MDESIRRELLNTAEHGLKNGDFIAYFQPQYNIATGLLVGAEALARWNHPEHGVLSPAFFISAFEKNKLITELDYRVFEYVCRFLRKALDKNMHMVPVSVNLSRIDVYTPGFLDSLVKLREEYAIPEKYIRLEVTESLAMENTEAAVQKVKEMHELGFTVELDDFGSGYSSLNVLKDIDYDVIKLDMLFLKDDMSGKGGTIVSSVVRMAKWMGLPVVAEGVETQQQADFMKSIGCDTVQGYLFSKPLPEAAYEAILSGEQIGLPINRAQAKGKLDPVSFWSDKSLETLVFNNYAGAAAVFSYKGDGSMEYLRVNRKFIREMGMNTTEEDIMRSDPFRTMNDEAKAAFKEMLRIATESEEEAECETWRDVTSSCCGSEKLCIRSTVLPIGKSGDEVIFYESIRNITAEKIRISEGQSYERGFRNITEQANIYYWEYTVATKEMRPCFRCMRDLGLPPLVTNYPEPAIEQGIFPPDYADMYRDWHKQIAAGAKNLDAIIPLTVGRVPFHVRYTTEFDALGRPVKAYGSATLVE